MKRSRKAAGDLALGFGEVSAIGLEPVRPDMRAVLTIDQLHVDLNLIAHPPHAALEHIANAQVAADLLRVDGFPLVSERGVSGDHELSEICERSVVRSSVMPSTKYS